MQVLKGDLLGLDFDLIVIPAIPSMRAGAGIAAKVLSKAGQEIVDVCKQNAPLHHGDAILTGAGEALCKGIIHCSIPLYIDGNHQEEELLKAAYWNAMVLAYQYLREQGLKKISVGMANLARLQGYDKDAAAKIAASTIKELYEQYPDAKEVQVSFVLEDEADYMRFKKAAAL
jgi:O-acetyl-ADP-ribose deacetylase (regulator of RNase III)